MSVRFLKISCYGVFLTLKTTFYLKIEREPRDKHFAARLQKQSGNAA
jgi:hypothetical protein